MPGSVESKMNNYVNAAMFSRPAPDTFGNMPRTISTYRSPSLKNADAAIFKNIHLAEQKYFQLRLEGFNITNTPTFATPHLSYGASNFGVIDTYAGGRGPREVQVAAKFYFSKALLPPSRARLEISAPVRCDLPSRDRERAEPF